MKNPCPFLFLLYKMPRKIRGILFFYGGVSIAALLPHQAVSPCSEPQPAAELLLHL